MDDTFHGSARLSSGKAVSFSISIAFYLDDVCNFSLMEEKLFVQLELYFILSVNGNCLLTVQILVVANCS